MREITITAMGSRGDVQPYVALGAALRLRGHPVRLVAPALFADLAAAAGLAFRALPAEADPQRIMRHPALQAAARRGGQLHVLLTILRVVRPTLDALFAALGDACADAEALVACSIPFGALDSAERLGVPAVWASLHALRPTRAFPNVFLAPAWLGPNHPLNPLSHRLMRAAFWLPMRGALNRWRRAVGLPPHGRQSYFTWVERQRTRTLYGFSTAVLPPPADYPPHHSVTGYWFLDPPSDWAPPPDLVRFLEAGPPPLAIGFGSMDDQRPAAATRLILEALRSSGRRAVLIAGWAGLGAADLPPEVLRITDIPHSWLFPRAAAVVHHGGAGTTAAGLRAGVPSVITPFAADQLFWARRVAQLGAGVAAPRLSALSASALAAAVDRAIGDPRIRSGAAALGARLRAEDGAARAAALIAAAVA